MGRTVEHVSWNYLNKRSGIDDFRLQLAAAVLDKETTDNTALHRLAELVVYAKPHDGEG